MSYKQPASLNLMKAHAHDPQRQIATQDLYQTGWNTRPSARKFVPDRFTSWRSRRAAET